MTWLFICSIIVLVIVPSYNATILHRLQEQAVQQNNRIIQVVNDNNALLLNNDEQLKASNQAHINASKEQRQEEQQLSALMANRSQEAKNNTQFLINTVRGLNITEVNEDLTLSKQNAHDIAQLAVDIKHVQENLNLTKINARNIALILDILSNNTKPSQTSKVNITR